MPARVGAFFHGTWQVLLVDGISGILRHAWQLFVEQSFSSLTRRIIVINMIGLVAFVVWNVGAHIVAAMRAYRGVAWVMPWLRPIVTRWLPPASSA